jgi:outer membrane protein assembly factor BamB
MPRYCYLLLLVCLMGLTSCGTSLEKNSIPKEGRQPITLDTTTKAQIPKATSAVAIPRPFDNKEWPMTGGYPDHALHHLTLSNDMRLLWRASIGKGNTRDSQLLNTPIVMGDMVVVMDSVGQVTALNANTGDRQWRTDTKKDDEDDPIAGGGLIGIGRLVFVTTASGELLCLSSENGVILWRVTLPAVTRGGPTLHQGNIYVLTIDNEVIAVSAKNGQPLWRYTGLGETSPLLGAPAIAAAGDIVVAVFPNGDIATLKADTGKPLWDDSLHEVKTTMLRGVGVTTGLPVITSGVVLAYNTHTLTAWRANNGGRLWTQGIGSARNLWVSGNTIFLVDKQNNSLTALDTLGHQRWRTTLPSFADMEDNEDPIEWLSPIVAGGLVWIPNTHRDLWGLNPHTGSVVKKLVMPEGAATDPIVAGRTLYIVGQSGDLMAFH